MESLGQELDQWLNSLEEALALMGEEIDNDREAIGGTVRDAAEKRGRLADRVSTLEKRLESIKGFAYEAHMKTLNNNRDIAAVRKGLEGKVDLTFAFSIVLSLAIAGLAFFILLT